MWLQPSATPCSIRSCGDSMEQFVVKDGKSLRLGYTTGSCATAAAKAACRMLLTGQKTETISILPPKGIPLTLTVEEITMGEEAVSCAIRKDGGDDPDITSGSLIFAEVSRREEPGIFIDGGFGVGRVTKRGLDQPVGNAAINSTPRKMIWENLEEVCRACDYHGGLQVIISVPDGEMLAKKTFNPRLGIVGGISILGTTGIVEPMSEKALLDTIRVELKQRKANGYTYVLLTPGNYGSDFIRNTMGIDPEVAVQSSNFIGNTIDMCKELGFQGALLIGHIGKLVKIAGGMMNTHSKYGDCRVEIMGAHAAAAGASPETVEEILSCVACDDVLRILSEHGGYEKTMDRILVKIQDHLSHRADEMEIGAVTFSKEYGLLGETPNARRLLKKILEDT